MSISKVFRFGSTMAIVLGSAALAWGEAPAKLPPMPQKPTANAIQALLKARVAGAIGAVTGKLINDCAGSKAALEAYNKCKTDCASKAENTPITPAEMEKCGSMTAAACAEMLVKIRAQACITAPAPAGCTDELRSLQKENMECAGCKKLTAMAAAQIAEVKEADAAVQKLEKELADARAKQTMAARRLEGLEVAAKRLCAAAAK
jgi:hypothetical protein